MSFLGTSLSLTGDIWSTGAFSFESPLKDLLDSKDYTLEQLLAEDELLQELRGLHPILTEYFSTEESVTKLVRYITLAPPSNTTENDFNNDNNNNNNVTTSTEEDGISSKSVAALTAAQRLNQQLEKKKKVGIKMESPESDPEFKHVRFPYLACEIICCEIDGILNTLVEGMVREEQRPHNNEEQEDEDLSSSAGEDIALQQQQNHESKNHFHPSPKRILDVLFDLLYDTPAGQLDDYRAGYFDKILSLLFRKKAKEISDYINTGGNRGQQSLMEAMMKHLYSHSITQLCQRLLLPPRPTPKINQDYTAAVAAPAGAGGPASNLAPVRPQAEDDEQPQGQDILPGDEDEAESGGGIKCNWSSSNLAIELLLDRLIIPESLLSDKDPTLDSHMNINEQSIQEQRLSLSLNAAEVLITVIQNSMLSSHTMLFLTSYPTIHRLSVAATTLKAEETFSPHESLLTSAMNVMESLILQLGGYGAVGTMSILEQADAQEPIPTMDPTSNSLTTTDQETFQTETAVGEQSTSEALVKGNLIANISSLLQVLPETLQAFAYLLRHPDARDWKSPVQFSKTEPVQLLGASRLRIVRVLESLVLLGDPAVDNKLVESDCLRICLDLFWEFQWCSMLHQSVANLLVHVFEGQNARFEIQQYLICTCNLIGRLIHSFIDTSDPRGLATDLGGVVDVEDNKSNELKDDSAAPEVLPVSEDDIDAALEKQQQEEEKAEEERRQSVMENVDIVSVEQETREWSAVNVTPPAQSFRFGYMGHVIIICQALVQACVNEWVPEQGDDVGSQQENTSIPPELAAAMAEYKSEPSMIAEMVNNHELSEQWQEFVISTLSAEIAVQSTPLGGLNVQPPDQLVPLNRMESGRRPGLADDGDVGDHDGALAPPVPRGMVASNVLHDMDDGDLEANRMPGFNLGRTDDASEGSGDSNRSYNSGGTNDSPGYSFDDPLGKAGSLGIELGKLTKYNSGENRKNEPDADDGSSSSDEEPLSRDFDDEEDDGGDPPVMDLFAGNFNHAAYGSPGDDKPDATAFDFADFGSAFVEKEDTGFADFTNSIVSSNPPDSPERPRIDEIFGDPSSVKVLEELDNVPSNKAEELNNPAEDAEIVVVSETSHNKTDETQDPPSQSDADVVMVSEAGDSSIIVEEKSDSIPPANFALEEGAKGEGSEILSSEQTGDAQKEGVLVA